MTPFLAHHASGTGSVLLVAPQHDAFDRELIEQYRSVIGDEGALDMVNLFLRTLPERRSDLTDAVAAGDLERTRRTGHAIKGMAAAVGATRLSAVGLLLQHAEEAEVGALVRRLEAASVEAMHGIAAAWQVDLH